MRAAAATKRARVTANQVLDRLPRRSTRRCRIPSGAAAPRIGDVAGRGPGITARALRNAVAASIRAGVALVALVGWAASLGFVHRQHNDVDLRTYRGAVTWWAHGHDLYSFYGIPRNHTLGFTYPPFAAVLMFPLSWTSTSVAYVIWSAAIVGCYALLVWWVLPEWLRQPGRRWLAVVVGVGLFYICPIRDTFSFGQVNIFFALAVVADYRALRRGSRWAGVGIGLATAIKLTPGIFIVYLLVTRRPRAAALATATMVAASMVAAAIAPATSAQYWWHIMWASNRVGQIASDSNQSLYGLLTRLLNHDTYPHAHAPVVLWAAGCLLVAVVGLWRARRANEAGDDLTGFTLAGLVAGLVSPISWIHHLVWFLPACVILADAAVQRRSWSLGITVAALYGAASSSVVVLNQHPGGHHYQDGPAGFLAENTFAVLALLLLALLPSRAAAGSETLPSRRNGHSPRQVRLGTARFSDARQPLAARGGCVGGSVVTPSVGRRLTAMRTPRLKALRSSTTRGS